MSAMHTSTSSSASRTNCLLKQQTLPNKPNNLHTTHKQASIDRSRNMGSALYSKPVNLNGQNASSAKSKSSNLKNNPSAPKPSTLIHQRSASASSLHRSSSANNLASKPAIKSGFSSTRNNSNQLPNPALPNGTSTSTTKQNGIADSKSSAATRGASLSREKNLLNGSDTSNKSAQKTASTTTDSSNKRIVSVNVNNNDTKYDPSYYNHSTSESSSVAELAKDSMISTQAFNNLEINNLQQSSKIATGYSCIPINNKRRQVAISDRSGLVGLSNLGNTCFMNSVLQCLSNTRPLFEFVLFSNWKEQLNRNGKMKGNLFEAYADLMRQIWETDESYVNPNNFRKLLQKFAPRFMGNAQQDSQEFLRYLLEGLHEDLNRVKQRPKRVIPNYDEEEKLEDTEKSKLYWERYLKMDDSIIVDLFTGQLMSTLRCTTCEYSSTTFDPFMDLSLPLPQRNSSSVSITDCFELFTKLEILDGDERPTCSRCKTRRRCTKGFTIQCFPKILVIHLKRFSGDRYRSKVTSLIKFPLKNLDLTKFAAKSCTTGSCSYNLYAVSNHSGTVYAGHYTASCRHPKSNSWFDYNDTRVKPTSDSSVQSPEAYVLFYELIER